MPARVRSSSMMPSELPSTRRTGRTRHRRRKPCESAAGADRGHSIYDAASSPERARLICSSHRTGFPASSASSTTHPSRCSSVPRWTAAENDGAMTRMTRSPNRAVMMRSMSAPSSRQHRRRHTQLPGHSAGLVEIPGRVSGWEMDGRDTPRQLWREVWWSAALVGGVAALITVTALLASATR
jgi:hypothetical protein